jgi:hypothetical protein
MHEISLIYQRDSIIYSTPRAVIKINKIRKFLEVVNQDARNTDLAPKSTNAGWRNKLFCL